MCFDLFTQEERRAGQTKRIQPTAVPTQQTASMKRVQMYVYGLLTGCLIVLFLRDQYDSHRNAPARIPKISKIAPGLVMKTQVRFCKYGRFFGAQDVTYSTDFCKRTAAPIEENMISRHANGSTTPVRELHVCICPNNCHTDDMILQLRCDTASCIHPPAKLHSRYILLFVAIHTVGFCWFEPFFFGYRKISVIFLKILKSESTNDGRKRYA